jgi:DNA-binding MarR family transcriptional regulator
MIIFIDCAYAYVYHRGMVTALPCYCATLRQAARALSQRYDAALRPAQLTLTQFTLLTALKEHPLARTLDLVEALAMDQTTLSRTLRIMERDGLIARKPGEDRRESHWTLTAEGANRRRRGERRWSAAQRDVEKIMGPQEARNLAAAIFGLTSRVHP